jgi:hypothetical protein
VPGVKRVSWHDADHRRREGGLIGIDEEEPGRHDLVRLAAGRRRAGVRLRVVEGWQTCVDRERSTAVEQRYCDDESRQPVASGYVPHYGWYYYPRSYYWEAPGIGAVVPGGGSYGAQPFGSTPMARSGGVVRGGLGATAAGHTTGGGGESGHASGGE